MALFTAVSVAENKMSVILTKMQILAWQWQHSQCSDSTPFILYSSKNKVQFMTQPQQIFPVYENGSSFNRYLWFNLLDPSRSVQNFMLISPILIKTPVAVWVVSGAKMFFQTEAEIQSLPRSALVPTNHTSNLAHICFMHRLNLKCVDPSWLHLLVVKFCKVLEVNPYLCSFTKICSEVADLTFTCLNVYICSFQRVLIMCWPFLWFSYAV